MSVVQCNAIEAPADGSHDAGVPAGAGSQPFNQGHARPQGPAVPVGPVASGSPWWEFELAPAASPTSAVG